MSVKKLCQHGSTDGPDNVSCKCWRPDKSSALQPVSPAPGGCCKELQEVLCLGDREGLPTGFDGSGVHTAVPHSLLALVGYLASLTFPNLEREEIAPASESWAQASPWKRRGKREVQKH